MSTAYPHDWREVDGWAGGYRCPCGAYDSTLPRQITDCPGAMRAEILRLRTELAEAKAVEAPTADPYARARNPRPGPCPTWEACEGSGRCLAEPGTCTSAEGRMWDERNAGRERG
jgi:hypothetical protein